MLVDHRQRVRGAALQQLRRRVQPLGIVEQQELRLPRHRRQKVADEGVDDHSGTTAVASISTSAALLTRPLTSTSAIAGKCEPMIAFQIGARSSRRER